MRAQAEWNVDTHMRWATGPTSSPTRSFISPAALLVNVIASSANGEARWSPISHATRFVSTRVLPDPAPATTSSGTSGGAVTASRCAGSDLGAGFEVELARHAVLGGHVVAPRAQQPRAVVIQRDRERAGLVVDV